MLSTFLRIPLLLFILHFTEVECQIREVDKTKREFTVDYDRGVFVKNQQPFQYISGGMHYFRMLPYYWEDRLLKAKACGLDAIEMYIPWNFHQPTPHQYDFAGRRDVVKFINLAAKYDLLVIVRGFPYADTEWDMGGLPYWLLSTNVSNETDPIKLRTTDQRFIAHVYNWFSVIMPKLRPLLYENGGPIIMVQIENEYGSVGSDKEYLNVLYNIIKKFLDDSVVYFTTDGNSVKDLAGGAINGTLQTCDFGAGSSANSSFAALIKSLPKGPHVNSEYYTGWLDHWGEPHHRVSCNTIVKSLQSMLMFNASVNFYMFYGGTNFEYWAGSNSGNHQITTSYDYDAPLSEAGDTTTKYFDIKMAIPKKHGLPVPVPQNSTKFTYGPLKMQRIGNIFEYLNNTDAFQSVNPLSFEDLGIIGGYVLYETQIKQSMKSELSSLVLSNGMKDVAQVFVNRELVGVINYGEKTMNFWIPNHRSVITVSLLVRSRGRVCYGSSIFDMKGLFGEVTLKADKIYQLKNWTMLPINLEKLYSMSQSYLPFDKDIHEVSAKPWKPLLPSLYIGRLSVSQFHDTFIDMSDGGWRSGYVVINGFNLGYYEPKSGPQLTLYAPLLGINAETGKHKDISVLVFETEPRYEVTNVFFTDTANIG